MKKCQICGKEVKGERLDQMNGAVIGKYIEIFGHAECLANVNNLVVIPNRVRLAELKEDMSGGREMFLHNKVKEFGLLKDDEEIYFTMRGEVVVRHLAKILGLDEKSIKLMHETGTLIEYIEHSDKLNIYEVPFLFGFGDIEYYFDDEVTEFENEV
jgi:hypothetical protein